VIAAQNGQGPFSANVISGTSYIKNGRDLGAWVHVDFAFQAYLFATQWGLWRLLGRSLNTLMANF